MGKGRCIVSIWQDSGLRQGPPQTATQVAEHRVIGSARLDHLTAHFGRAYRKPIYDQTNLPQGLIRVPLTIVPFHFSNGVVGVTFGLAQGDFALSTSELCRPGVPQTIKTQMNDYINHLSVKTTY